jgi:type II secretory pathway component GspD/PulD (secretin)
VGGKASLKAGIIDEDVAVFLRVLDEVTDVTVISNPKVLTLNRQAARVLVGTRVGYLNTTTTQTATTQTVEFLDTGTQLHIRPFVSSDNLIRLEVKPQVSSASLRESVTQTGQAVTIPDEDTTELVTNLLVRDGQTVVLGGLFTESTSYTRRQVPFLGDIPSSAPPSRGRTTRSSATRSSS